MNVWKLSILEDRMSVTRRTWIILSVTSLIMSLGAAVVFPRILAPLFEGAEGTRWVAPLLIWLGAATSLSCLFLARAPAIEASMEVFFSVGITIVFSSLFGFIVIQRLSSGQVVGEGFSNVMIFRLAHGGSLYPDPETAAMGTVYMPLYFLLSAGLQKIWPGFMACGRVVSAVAIILTAWVVFRTVLARTKDKAVALWALALFSLSYGTMAHLYDRVSVDPLLVLLLACTLYWLEKDTRRGDMIALLFAGLAVCTKQTALFPYLATFGLVVIRRRWLSAGIPVFLLALFGGGLLLITDGRAWDYLVTLPSEHDAWRMFPFLPNLYHFCVLQLPLWLGCIAQISKEKRSRFLLFSFSVLIASLIGVWKSGGWINALLPFQPILCIAAAPYLSRIRLLLIIQLVLAVYNPFGPLYTWSRIRDVDRAAVAIARDAEGDVWFPSEGYLAYVVGKPEYDHFGSLEAVGWAGRTPPKRLLDALETKRISLVMYRISAERIFRRLHPLINQPLRKNYVKERIGRLVVYRAKGG